MSLISNTDFLIHSLRLSYLRDVEDPYGARLITLDPSYNSNPYILAASLADVDRWPELAMPSSPQLSEDEGERPSGFPGARLKYTNAIMGRRSGGLGLRVSGKRASVSKRMSGTPRQVDVKNFISEDAPVQEALSTTVPVSASLGERERGADSWVKVPDDAVNAGTTSSQPNLQDQETAVAEAPVTKVVQYIPKFKGAEEMEARRRVRMAARRGPGGSAPQPPPPPPNLDFSSSDEDVGATLADDSSSDEFDVTGGNDSMDDGDEFDPDFAATRSPGGNSDSASYVLSVFSNSIPSTSNSSIPVSSSHHPRHRLSPVSEGGRTDDQSPQRSADQPIGSLFEMVTPLPPPNTATVLGITPHAN